jgi:FtsP/CotA-like multicopper oxidase with cupredoxin domain
MFRSSALSPPLASPSRRLILKGVGVSFVSLALPFRPRAAAGGPMLLKAAPASLAILPDGGPLTPTLAYNGTTPGPVIRVKRGEEVAVRLVNGLDRPTTLHWHGVRLVNAMDGAAGLTQPAVAPGASFDYRFTAHDAGTYWYHPHIHGDTARQLDAGLYGLLIVGEERPPVVDRDIAIVIDDWSLGEDGRILPPTPMEAVHAGRIGQRISVNSKPVETLALRRHERIRLRLVNVANSRIASLAFAGFDPFVVALDGQPTDGPFLPAGARLDLSPGGRADLILDGMLEEGARAGIAMRNGAESVEIVRLTGAPGDPARPARLPEPTALPANNLPRQMALDQAKRIELVMEGGPKMGAGGAMEHTHMSKGIFWSLNGSAGDGHSGTPLFSVARGTVVTIRMINKSIFAHSIHVHGHAMRVLHPFDDGWEPYWLDTVLVKDGETVPVAFVADSPGKWMVHCHMVEHQESGMATWFEVKAQSEMK